MDNNIKMIYESIIDFAKQCKANKVVLFGSRARGTNQDKSDIDIAVYGCSNFEEFEMKIDEELWSLLNVDVINMNESYISKELISEIERDGVVLYEKI